MVTVRHIERTEYTDFRATLFHVFGGDIDEDYERDHGIHTVEHDRCIGAFEGSKIVGTMGTYSLDMTVPGGVSAPVAGMTMVSVLPTHRRRGVLTQMVHAHFDEAFERDEHVSGLWAAEAPIYGRFGYGSANDTVDLQIERPHLTVTDPPANLRPSVLPADEALPHLESIYERIRLTRPGLFARSHEWWRHRRALDLPAHRRGASSYRHLVLFSRETAAGYALYRVKEDWGGGVPNNAIVVGELAAVDAEVELAIAAFLNQIDLVGPIKLNNRPVDDPLIWRIADRRRLTQETGDALWVRLLDVPGALEQRRYEAPGRVVLRVLDDFADRGGTFALEVDDAGRAHCHHTDADPDLAMPIATLGALYLGGRDARALHRAGLVHGTHAAVVRLHHMFSWSPAPWTPEVF